MLVGDEHCTHTLCISGQAARQHTWIENGWRDVLEMITGEARAVMPRSGVHGLAKFGAIRMEVYIPSWTSRRVRDYSLAEIGIGERG
jgi:hypothetical protein